MLSFSRGAYFPHSDATRFDSPPRPKGASELLATARCSRSLITAPRSRSWLLLTVDIPETGLAPFLPYTPMQSPGRERASEPARPSARVVFHVVYNGSEVALRRVTVNRSTLSSNPPSVVSRAALQRSTARPRCIRSPRRVNTLAPSSSSSYNLYLPRPGHPVEILNHRRAVRTPAGASFRP